MATNMVHKNGDQVLVPLAATSWPTATANAESGDPYVLNDITGVCLADSVDDEVVIRRKGTFDLKVYAMNNEDNNSASAVGIGDALYINASTGVINKWTGGVLFGHAMEAIASGNDVIEVLLK